MSRRLYTAMPTPTMTTASAAIHAFRTVFSRIPTLAATHSSQPATSQPAVRLRKYPPIAKGFAQVKQYWPDSPTQHGQRQPPHRGCRDGPVARQIVPPIVVDYTELSQWLGKHQRWLGLDISRRLLVSTHDAKQPSQ